MSQHITFVANFKMNLTAHQEIEYVTHNLARLTQCAADPTCRIVLCPSFLSLAPLGKILTGSHVGLGSQDSSSLANGPHTGQVSAHNLYEVGCRFGIVGHSETRKAYHLSDAAVVGKALHLIQENINPIVCIGEEPGEQWEAKLTEQLTPLFNALLLMGKHPQHQHLTLYLAYEPLSAIGTGVVPAHAELEKVFAFLAHQVKAHALHLPIKLLYGGSVKHHNIASLLTIPSIDGFLVGNASLNFQEFEKLID